MKLLEIQEVSGEERIASKILKGGLTHRTFAGISITGGWVRDNACSYSGHFSYGEHDMGINFMYAYTLQHQFHVQEIYKGGFAVSTERVHSAYEILHAVRFEDLVKRLAEYLHSTLSKIPSLN